MEDTFLVSGGKPLKGEVKLSGAKNVALKVMIAALLFKEKIFFSNIPRIKDVEVLMNLINKLGSTASFIQKNQLTIEPKNLVTEQIDLIDAAKIRVSFMFFAPLLHRLGRAKIPNPGGCRLGGRPIDRSINLIRSFGVKIFYDEKGFYNAQIKGKKLKACHYSFEKPSHTSTELAIMLGCLADGETVIDNASLEPEVDDLINFLNLSGAKIKRSKRKIIIQGVKELKFNDDYHIISDRNEAVTYAIFGLATGGEIEIYPIKPSLIATFIEKSKEAGAQVKIADNRICFKTGLSLRSTKITTKPHPGFMTDWQAPWAVLMTQAKGESIIHETVFENRFSYVPELRKLGAKIDFFQPRVRSPKNTYHFNLDGKKLSDLLQAIKIWGKTKLHNGVLSVSDLRAGASLLIGAAVAEGESIINGAGIIERGYEDIAKKLSSLGLNIKKI